jgi:hypothetical protein
MTRSQGPNKYAQHATKGATTSRYAIKCGDIAKNRDFNKEEGKTQDQTIKTSKIDPTSPRGPTPGHNRTCKATNALMDPLREIFKEILFKIDKTRTTPTTNKGQLILVDKEGPTKIDQ